MTEHQSKTNPVKGFFAEISWKIKQGFSAVNRFIERFLPFLTRWPDWAKAILYLAPAMLILGVFTIYPIFNSIILSFLEGYSIFDGMNDGITLWNNYYTVLSHANFSQSVLNTVYIAIITVPATILISLFIAVSMSSIKFIKGFYQSMYFLPYVTNTIAIGLVFAFMFRGTTSSIYPLGLMNQIIVWFGGTPIPWIGAGATYLSALAVILIYTIWNGLAFKIIVFMAGIQGIDKQYYQAAQIDGATKWKTLRKITIPLISPMIFYILITSVIGAFKTYSSIVAIINPQGMITTGADGNINLKTIVFYVYDYLAPNLIGQPGSVSYAAAAAIILFVMILILTAIQFQVGKRRIHY